MTDETPNSPDNPDEPEPDNPDNPVNPRSGGGGCDANVGLGILGLALLAPLGVGRKRGN